MKVITNPLYTFRLKSSILITCCILFFILANSFLSAQPITNNADSLRRVIRTSTSDTQKINALNNLAFNLKSTNPDSTLQLAKQAYALSEKAGWGHGKAVSLNHIGVGYDMLADYPTAMEYYKKALQAFTDDKDLHGEASAMSNVGIIYWRQGDYSQAMDYDTKAEDIDKQIGNTKGQAIILANMANIYNDQGDYPKALDITLKGLQADELAKNTYGVAEDLSNLGIMYDEIGSYHKAMNCYDSALVIFQKMGNTEGQAMNLTNMGTVYDEMNDFSKSLEYDNKALKIYQGMGNKEGQATLLGNIGDVCSELKRFPDAFDYFIKALALNKQIGDKGGCAINYTGIGQIYLKTGKFELSGKYLDSSLTLSKKIGDKELIKSSYDEWAKLDSAMGNYKAAYTDYRNYIVYRDSLKNEANTKKIVSQEMQYEFDKKEAAEKADQEKKDAVNATEKKRQLILTAAISLGLLLVLVFSGLLLNRFRITQRQKVIIEKQKQIVEEKNKEVLDSITYAKRLQDAILPPPGIIRQNLPDSFVLYKPKDIVAGDFYWLAPPFPEGGSLLIAAADCTGHGVPGAMVSVVCSNALNRTVKEFKITEPGKILDKTRELVIETFEKSEGNIQDGMDISLAAISRQPLANSIEVKWAGAFNSLWYIENGEMKELPADKQPIGKTDSLNPFTTHTLNLNKGDSLYLFTDGYADQFGGPKGKKFKYKPLQEKILAISHQPMVEQQKILEKTLNDWKGGLEQVDDILIIGIRV